MGSASVEHKIINADMDNSAKLVIVFNVHQYYIHKDVLIA
jgi:hypothetical protein